MFDPHSVEDGPMGFSCLPELPQPARPKSLANVPPDALPHPAPAEQEPRTYSQAERLGFARLALSNYVLWMIRYLFRNVHGDYSLRPPLEPSLFQPWLAEADSLYSALDDGRSQSGDRELREAASKLQRIWMQHLDSTERCHGTGTSGRAYVPATMDHMDVYIAALQSVVKLDPPDKFLLFCARMNIAEQLRRKEQPNDALSALAKVWSDWREQTAELEIPASTRANFSYSIEINLACCHLDLHDAKETKNWLDLASRSAQHQDFDSRLLVFWEINSISLHLIAPKLIDARTADTLFEDLFWRNPGFLRHCVHSLRKSAESEPIDKQRLAKLATTFSL